MEQATGCVKRQKEKTMAKYRKKPVVIDAVQFTKSGQRQEFQSLIGAENKVSFGGDHILIETLEGTMRAEVGDWIIKGVKGEIYTCKDEIFRMTYEPAESDDLTLSHL